MATAISDDVPAMQLTGWNRILLLVVVIASGAAYNAATFTASAILPQMQGGMSATQDEISWTVTFNILATAIVTPMTGWLVARFGQRNILIACLSGFIAATIMCGLSNSLEQIVLWRIMQGAAGAPLLPIGQTLLLDAFPRRQHTLVISLFGMANTIGPVAGPTLGGYLAEHYSWRWSFFMVVPLSALSLIGVIASMPRTRSDRHSRLGEQVSVFNKALIMPWVAGGWSIESVAGLARLSRELNRQAAIIGYVNAFVMYTIASTLGIALTFLVRPKAPQ